MKHITNIADSPAAKIKTPHKNTGIKTKAYIGSDDINTFLDAISGHRLEVGVFACIVLWIAKGRDSRLKVEYHSKNS